jgi:uncharacterized membrane protein YfcA
MDQAVVAAVVLVASFTQGLTGFGAALVVMPLLSPVLGPRTAAPFMALVAAGLQVVLIARYHRAVNWGAVWRLSLPALLATPVGVYGLRVLDERLTLSVLAAVVIGYAVYGLAGPRLPGARHAAWPYAAGFAGGLLGGAYNTNGPPVVVYGHCRRWSPAEFKGTLTLFFTINGAGILASHAATGGFTPAVWEHFLWALPALAVGVVAGVALDRRVNAARFRTLVLVLLLLLGARLVLRVIAGV